MRFDMNLLPMYFPDVHPPFDAYFGQILGEVELAEDLGFECFWFTEHHFLVYGGPIPNPAVFLSAAAARTSKIKLGSAISIVPLRHPLQTAEDYAMMDAISGGRLEFGVGRGNTPLDYQMYGVDQADNRARFEEAMEVITTAWANETFSHHGRFWDFTDVSVCPKPAQRPLPSIWVAANSNESATWAGTHGYHMLAVAHTRGPEAVREHVETWKTALATSGRKREQVHSQLMVRMHVDEDGERARQTALRAFERYDEIAAIRRTRTAEPAPPDQMLRTGRNIYGDPDEVIAGIKRAQEHFEFDTLACVFNFGGIPHERVKAAMRLFAQEVVPAFQ